MKSIFTFLACILLASCADRVPPRAIIPDTPPVERINVQPVRDASDKLTEATSNAGKAAGDSIRAAEKSAATGKELLGKIQKLELISQAEKEISEALRAAISDLSATTSRLDDENMDLTAANTILQAQMDSLAWTNQSLVTVIRNHEIEIEKQATTIDQQNRDSVNMKRDLDALNNVRDDLVKSEANVTNLEEDKTTMAWWIVGLGLYAFISTVAIIFLLLKVLNPLG